MKQFVLTFLFLVLMAVAAYAKININTASAEELSTLPGIGDKKAQSIIIMRKQLGSFKTVDDLSKVKGISEKMVTKLKDKITVTE